MTSMWVTGVEKSKTLESLHEAEAGTFVTPMLIEKMRVFKTLVARNLDEAAAAVSQLLLSGLQESSADTGSAHIFPHDEDSNSSDGPFSVKGNHHMKPAESDHDVPIGGDQLRDPLICEELHSPCDATCIDGVVEETDEIDNLRRVFLSCFANNGHSVSRTWMITPTRPPTKVPLMRMYWRSRPTAASRRAVTVRASQVRTVSETRRTIELP